VRLVSSGLRRGGCDGLFLRVFQHDHWKLPDAILGIQAPSALLAFFLGPETQHIQVGHALQLGYSALYCAINCAVVKASEVSISGVM
jgi:hypothetical protein